MNINWIIVEWMSSLLPFNLRNVVRNFKFAIVALQLFKCLWDSGLKNSSILNFKLQNPKRPFIIKETKRWQEFQCFLVLLLLYNTLYSRNSTADLELCSSILFISFNSSSFLAISSVLVQLRSSSSLQKEQLKQRNWVFATN